MPTRRPLLVLGLILAATFGAACADSEGEDNGGDTRASPSTTTTSEPRDPAHQQFCLAAGSQLAAAPAISQRLAGPIEGVESAVAELRAQNLDVGATVPEVIRADVALVVEAGLRYLDILEQAGFDMAKVPADARETLQTPEVAAAANREAVYLEEECGLDVDGSSR